MNWRGGMANNKWLFLFFIYEEISLVCSDQPFPSVQALDQGLAAV